MAIQRVLCACVGGRLGHAGALGGGLGYLDQGPCPCLYMIPTKYWLVLSSPEGNLRDVLRSCSDELIIKYL